MKKGNFKWLLHVWLALAFGLAACSGSSKPVIQFNPIGGQIVAGQEITVQSVAADDKGIARVEFAADNVLVSESKVDPPQKKMTLPHLWKAEVGQHTLSVRAFNVDNLGSELAAMVVVVAPTPAAPTEAAPTSIPAPATKAPGSNTPVPGPTSKPAPGPCALNAAFIKDVTVPDGTPWKAGQAFNKIWQVQNTGTCTWSNKYSLAWVSGEPMSNTRSIALPGNVAPGQLTDILVAMNAPSEPGTHVGKWQLRDENNSAFGSVLNVSIVTLPAPPQAAITSPGTGFHYTVGTTIHVTFAGNGNSELASVSLYANGALLAKQTSRTPSKSISAAFDWRPAAGNYDVYAVAVDIYGQQTTSPHIGGTISQPQCQTSINFRADRTTINAGEHTMLRWDVDCARAVYLDGAGVNGHDGRDVGPGSTQTYTMRVTRNDGANEDRQVTIHVNQPVPPTPAPQRRNITGTWNSNEYTVHIDEALGCSSADCPIAGTLTHAVLPTPSTHEISGTFHAYNGSVSFSVTMPGGQSFSGTVSADSRTMSGTLSGVGGITFTK